MANFPRWVDNKKVDSSAMLSAYINTVRPTDWWFGQLVMWDHKMDDGGIPNAFQNPSVIKAKCNSDGCPRCMARAGGYKFRWYHDSWGAKYSNMARPGAWKPGDDESDTPDVSAPAGFALFS